MYTLISTLRRDSLSRILFLISMFFFVSANHVNTADANSNYLRINVERGSVATAKVRPGRTLTVETDVAFSDIVVGNQEVADIVPLSDTSLYIQGKAVGATNVTLYDEEKKLLSVIDVLVQVDGKTVEEAIRATVPTSRIRVTNVGNRIRLSGTVKAPTDLPQVTEVAQQFSTEPVIRAISVGQTQQVSIEVRVLEASRTVGRSVGVNLLASTNTSQVTFGDRVGQDVATVGAAGTGSIVPVLTAGQGLVSAGLSQSLPFGTILANLLSAGNTEIDALIDALEAKGVARSLAQPNLTSISGEAARFHVGGEVPITSAVSTGGGTAEQVEFRPFGVRLEFVPTVLDNDKVNLRILTEVSDIDPSIVVNGVPGFSSRRAETVVELRDGQSFSLAGLLQTENNRTLQQFPWIGGVPILGSLFRSAAFQKEETDLVIIATPRLVRPAAPDEKLASPLDQTRSSNDVEFFGLGLIEVDKDMLRTFRDGEGIDGPYGHIIDLEFDDEFVAKK